MRFKNFNISAAFLFAALLPRPEIQAAAPWGFGVDGYWLNRIIELLGRRLIRPEVRKLEYDCWPVDFCAVSYVCESMQNHNLCKAKNINNYHSWNTVHNCWYCCNLFPGEPSVAMRFMKPCRSCRNRHGFGLSEKRFQLKSLREQLQLKVAAWAFNKTRCGCVVDGFIAWRWIRKHHVLIVLVDVSWCIHLSFICLPLRPWMWCTNCSVPMDCFPIIILTVMLYKIVVVEGICCGRFVAFFLATSYFVTHVHSFSYCAVCPVALATQPRRHRFISMKQAGMAWDGKGPTTVACHTCSARH